MEQIVTAHGLLFSHERRIFFIAKAEERGILLGSFSLTLHGALALSGQRARFLLSLTLSRRDSWHEVRKRMVDHFGTQELGRVYGPVRLCRGYLDVSKRQHIVNGRASYASKDRVLVLQLGRRVERDEKLAFIRVVFAGIGHRHEAPAMESEALVALIFKWRAIERFAAVACPGRIARLDNKAGHDAVPHTLIIVALEGECDKVAASLGRFFGPQLDLNFALRRV